MGELGWTPAGIILSGGHCREVILYGLHFLHVLWMDALNIFILIVFPLMCV